MLASFTVFFRAGGMLFKLNGLPCQEYPKMQHEGVHNDVKGKLKSIGQT
jgi:hypothetical protein